MYDVDILIPTARFVFSVEGSEVRVLPEHRSREAFAAYRDLRDQRPVVGMITFPNTVLLRGSRTIVVDPGMALQNEPVLRALALRGISPSDIDLVVLTHAHFDHAGGCAHLAARVAVHELEMLEPHWALVGGALERLPVERLLGVEGDLAPGVRWALTPGHSAGHISVAVESADGTVVICGDAVGPSRDGFDSMRTEGPAASEVLASWRRIRAWKPVRVIPGHLAPFAP